MKTSVRTLVAVGLLALTAAMVGCESPYREDIRTVAVPIWYRGSDVYRRDVEFRLTEAIVKRIELDTPYKVVADRSQADTVLEGTIVEIEGTSLVHNPRTGAPRSSQARIVVEYKWIDLRTGEVLAERTNLSEQGTFYPASPLREDFYEGSADGINRLAERIVETMEKPW